MFVTATTLGVRGYFFLPARRREGIAKTCVEALHVSCSPPCPSSGTEGRLRRAVNLNPRVFDILTIEVGARDKGKFTKGQATRVEFDQALQTFRLLKETWVPKCLLPTTKIFFHHVHTRRNHVASFAKLEMSRISSSFKWEGDLARMGSS